MHEPTTPEQLIQALDATIGHIDGPRAMTRIKDELEELICSTFVLPERFRHAQADSYARRLLHRNPELDYTVVVMTWGPGQGTSLHDHAGIWCVECVVQGQLEVEQYDLLQRQGERCRFAPRSKVVSGIGEAGCLIPPYEYHVLSNALEDETSISLHVYGGEMDHCHLYVPREQGWWDMQTKVLAYD